MKGICGSSERESVGRWAADMGCRHKMPFHADLRAVIPACWLSGFCLSEARPRFVIQDPHTATTASTDYQNPIY